MQLGIEATRSESSEAAVWSDVQSIVSGVVSASALGLAWAARAGPSVMVMHAIGMMGVVAGTAMLSVVPLWVLALHLGLALRADTLLAIVARAIRVTGIVLLGLSPTVALVSITAESVVTVGLVGLSAIALGGALGLRTFSVELDRAVGGAPFGRASWVKSGIFLFAALAALRLGWTLLPIVRAGFGGSS